MPVHTKFVIAMYTTSANRVVSAGTARAGNWT